MVLVLLGKMNAPAPAWLQLTMFDEHEYRALYPYSRLRNILKPDDVPSAISDESAFVQQEFGEETLKPLYNLIWLFNTLPFLYTIQTQFAPRDLKANNDCETQVACQILFLPRDPREHASQHTTGATVSWLFNLISEKVAQQNPNATGWMVTVGPTPVTLIRLRRPDAPYPYRDEDFVDMPGLGSVLRIYGFANTRVEAAERWQAAVAFIARAIEEEQTQNRLGYAEPYRHHPG